MFGFTQRDLANVLLCLLVAIVFTCINAEAPRNAVVVFEKGEGGYFCLKIPYLFRTLVGTLIAMSEGRGKDGRNSCDDWSGTDLVFKRSLDNGQTWSTLGTIWSNSSSSETNVVGNAGIVQDFKTGRIWVPLCRNNEEVYILYSDDDGVTFSLPVHHPELVQSDWAWVGLGPPAGLQLSTGRMLIPSYHTTKYKGDGEISKGHTLYSDDNGATWHIGSPEFGAPYLSNECQAVELQNGSVLINARTLTPHRIQVLSHDGGLTFDSPVRMENPYETVEGCEASMVRDPASNILYYSGAYSHGLIRRNMTVLRSLDEGATWEVFRSIDRGAVAYSALQIIPPPSTSAYSISPKSASSKAGKASYQDQPQPLYELTDRRSQENELRSHLSPSILGLLYERSDNMSIVFAPDQILFVPILLG